MRRIWTDFIRKGEVVFKPLFGYLIVRRCRSFWLVFMISCWVSSIANAATLTLVSGEKITGQIIKQTQLHVTIDVNGMPKTYFVGEIASVDGKLVKKSLRVVHVQGEKNPVVVPYYHDEQDSLVRFMNKHKPSAPVPIHPAGPKIHVPPAVTPPAPAADKTDALVRGLYEMMGKMAGMNKNVVSTPDGGIIVISPEKIVKYDRNLNVIKQINLNAGNNTAGSK